MVYQPNIPTGNVDLDQDYLNLRGNFQQLETTFGIDHLPFSNSTAQLGFHKAVHLITQSDPPNSTAGQLYSKVATIPPGGDAQLFYKTVMGGIEQISGNVALPNGYGWFSGILIQWGVKATTGIGTSVLFATANIDFDHDCFVVVLTPTNPAFVSGQSFSVPAKSKTGFTLGTSSGYPVGTNFFWVAIGN